MAKKMRMVGLVCVLGLVCSLQAAVTGMDDAVGWYKLYDGTTGSAIVSTQIVDSTGNLSCAYSTVGTAPTWDTCDAVRDGVATVDSKSVDMDGVGGIKLFQKTTASANAFEDALYGSHTDYAVAGSFTMFFRVYVNDEAYSWDQVLSVFSHYAPNKTTTGASGVTLRLLGSSTTSNPDSSVVRFAAKVGDNTAYSYLINNGLDIKIGEWADIAFSYDAVNGTILMSAYDSEGFEVVEFDYSGLVVPADQHVIVGSSLNTALSGYTMYLDGSIESFAMWDTALTTYELKALSMVTPTLLDGDANGDGIVSAGDYASIQSNFGHTGDPDMPGDANHDGVVSAGDYAAVQSNYGTIAGSSVEVTPEPATLCVLVGGSLALIRRRK